MKKSRTLLLLVGLTLSWTVSLGQSLDELTVDGISHSVSEEDMVLYSAPRWKIRRLVQIALSAATCDTLVQYQEKEINRGLQLIEASDAELVARSLKQRLTEIERDEWRSKYDRQVLLTNDQRKKARRRTWSTIALGGITIFFGYLAAKQ